MKKVIVIALTLVLVFALSVPAFASVPDDLGTMPEVDGKPYVLVFIEEGNYQKYKAFYSAEPFQYNGTTGKVQIYGDYVEYRLLISNNTWDVVGSRAVSTPLETGIDDSNFYWTNHNVVIEGTNEVKFSALGGDFGDGSGGGFSGEFTTYNGVTLPALPDGISADSPYLLISRISGASFGQEYAEESYYILDYATCEATVTHTDGYVVFHYADATLNRYIYTTSEGVRDALVSQGNNASNVTWGDVNVATVNSSRSYGVDELVWSNYDVKDGNGTVFFGLPLSLVQTVRGVQMEAVMTQVLLMIPIVVAFLVLCVGLRKALATLRRILSQA